MPTPYKSDIEETQVSYGSKSDNNTSETLSESNDFVSCDNSDKSSDSETNASCDSSLKTKTKDFPPAVDIKTLSKSDVEDPNSTSGNPSFSCLENVKSPRIFCNKSGMNNRNVCKNNSVRVKKCFVCGSKLHLIKDCDFYNCVDSVPCKSKAASVSAGSRNSPASVPAGRSDSAASRNRPAVNSAGRPNPAGWSKRPATVSAGRPVSAGWLNPAARPYFRPSSVYFNNMYWPDLYDPMYMNKGRWGTAVKTSAGDPTSREAFVTFGATFNWSLYHKICDKKNKVLFTDTDCLVLSEEFQLPDESQVQKPPWMNPPDGTEDGSRNFKTINKLAKEGLVDGLPLKVFTNEHNCVACNKGKQHKASYTSISAVRLITEPLQLLHMDLFGPTEYNGSIDQKYLKPFGLSSKAYRVYNLTNKRVEETMNLRFLEDKPNVQGIGTQETNIPAGTQAQDSDSDVEEQVIVVPSFPSNSFAGPSSSNGPSVMERNADYAEELAKLQRQYSTNIFF
ncbi:hypothetical protein Tco_1330101, partial [Tanacetum coccineum]